MLTGDEPEPDARPGDRAVPDASPTDHGFNASTFTARVITSTQADLAASICGAIGALSGPLHGGAPSRALDMLDAIGTPDNAEPWLRSAVEHNDRLMGFGHRVYKTEDPRSTLPARGRPATSAARSWATPRRWRRSPSGCWPSSSPAGELYTNVEFYAGVVMNSCGVPEGDVHPDLRRQPAPSVGRVNVLEQMADNRLIRPTARYVGPTAAPAGPLPLI